MLKVFKQLNSFKERVAIESEGIEFSYAHLIEKSDLIASFLLGEKKDLMEERIGFLINPNIDYLCTLWGIWKAGGIAVPLSLSAKENELDHYISDCAIKLIITSDSCQQKENIPDKNKLDVKNLEDLLLEDKSKLPDLSHERKAMILYTSGTTNKPKGVVCTHKNVEAQISALVEAWEWTKEDHIPLFLPLHHIHGIINSLSCPLFVGAKVTMLGPFDAEKICSEVASKIFTVFTAVPTIYFSLIEQLENSMDSKLTEGFREMRLMMSGSAALAPEIHKKWQQLTGQELLERYGMTEVGMALSNKINGERRPGSVGVPLPGVEVRLEDDKGKTINNEGEAGQLLIKGPQVFQGYLNLPDKTKESFKEGWFITGDVVMLERGYYKILGRDSVDIIKSGGYKISALEIEDVLLRNDKIKECAVVGIPDDKWGEIVATVLVIRKEAIQTEEIQQWCSSYLSDYKIPRRVMILENLPKNSMGKITKPELKEILKNN
jgi:malonyl-CoA/methylmalonyl-CoA synthetase